MGPRTNSTKNQCCTNIMRFWIIAICVFVFSLGCNEQHSLLAPATPLPELDLAFGSLTPLPKAPEHLYSPLTEPGTIVEEHISSVLESEGIPPVRIATEASGVWSGTKEKPILKDVVVNITPTNAPLSADIKKALEQGAPPAHLPLGPLALFDNNQPTDTLPQKLELKANALGEKLQTKGQWLCNQGYGMGDSGSTRWLRCTLENGQVIQPHDNESRTRQRDARLQGRFVAFRAATDGAPQVSVEEIRIHLSAWSESPRPTLIELRYHRKTCLNEKNCPFSKN